MSTFEQTTTHAPVFSTDSVGAVNVHCSNRDCAFRPASLGTPEDAMNWYTSAAEHAAYVLGALRSAALLVAQIEREIPLPQDEELRARCPVCGDALPAGIVRDRTCAECAQDSDYAEYVQGECDEHYCFDGTCSPNMPGHDL